MSCNTVGVGVCDGSVQDRAFGGSISRLRPGLLPLEERRLLSVFTVTNTNGSGPGSLPYEVGQANSTRGANQVIFDSSVFGSQPQTIGISQGGNQINLSNTVGAGADHPARRPRRDRERRREKPGFRGQRGCHGVHFRFDNNRGWGHGKHWRRRAHSRRRTLDPDQLHYQLQLGQGQWRRGATNRGRAARSPIAPSAVTRPETTAAAMFQHWYRWQRFHATAPSATTLANRTVAACTTQLQE